MNITLSFLKYFLKKNYLIISAVFVALALIVSSTLYKPKDVHAQTLTTTFGGEVEDVQYCCDGLEISVGDPDGGDYLLSYDSVVYSDYNVFVPDGQNVLGTAVKGAVCFDPESYCEDSRPVSGGTMLVIGSSE